METISSSPGAATTVRPGEAMDLAHAVGRVRQVAEAVRANIERVIVGKAAVIDLLLVALLSEGHALIEDAPGMGKTMMARALARSLNTTFARIQGTADLLPGDITGVSYFNQKLGEFEFRRGPIFANIVLADEINRATPRTQSAMLEAMQERQVTVEGQAQPLPPPFLLIATQNPIELEGTFPLPEAQLDRFLLRLRVAYPTFDEEREMLFRFKEAQPLDMLAPVISGDELTRLLPVVRAVRVARPVADYLLTIVRETRRHPAIELGASPRAALALFRASQSLAAMQGRDYVKPDDIKLLATPTLAHRLIVTAQSRVNGQDVEDVVRDVVAKTPAPVERL
ncbi:MAG TPA: MoxR family ATPase [Ktedonobacterales bacterium]|nr:MoxR family ATPase [Ktedonobacterales bacterium]